jgi:sulfur-carrier protein
MTHARIRVRLPAHLRNLARIDGETQVDVETSDATPVSIGSVLDAIESAYPMLRGTIRDHSDKRRRAFIRFFVCEEDWSHLPSDTALPAPIIDGREPFHVIGAMAGGVTDGGRQTADGR